VVLSEETVEWVEDTLVDLQLLVRLAGEKVHEGLDLSGGGIESSGSDSDGSWLGQNIQDPESWRTSAPGVAKYWLVVAVQVGQVGSSRVDRPQERSLVECLLHLGTLAEASGVSSSNENPPLLWGGGSRLDTGADGLLPVTESQDVQSPAPSLSCGSLWSMRLIGIGNERHKFVEIHLCLVKRRLLRGSQDWQSEQGEGREAHDCSFW